MTPQTNALSEQTGCALCGDTKSKKRECYYYAAQDKFDPGYTPRLTYDERCVLQSGFNPICENRSECRKRYQEIKKPKRLMGDILEECLHHLNKNRRNLRCPICNRPVFGETAAPCIDCICGKPVPDAQETPTVTEEKQ
jgi:hypothetical protein